MQTSRKKNTSLLVFLIYQLYIVNCSMQKKTEYGKSRETTTTTTTTTTTSTTKNIRNDNLKEQIKNVRNYELVNPAIYNAGDLNGKGVSSTIVHIGAFGMNYDLVLENRKVQSSYRTLVEYYGKNNTYEAKYLRDYECFHSGVVNTTDNQQLEVTLNYCDGVEGMILSNEALLFIEPIKVSNSQKKTIVEKHIVYKGEDVHLDIEKNDFKDNVRNDDFIKGRGNSTTTTTTTTRKRERRAVKVNTPYQSYLTFINKSGRTVQLYYLDEFNSHIPFITFVLHEKRNVNTYKGTTWIAKDDQTDQILYLNGNRKLVAEKNNESKRTPIIISKPDSFKEDNLLGDGEITNSVGGDHHYIEVLVVADDSVIRFHGKDKIEKYILTMMDIAARVFKHNSLGMMIHFQVVRIVLIEDNQAGFEVYKKNPTRTLKSACNFISSLRSSDENDPDHFDFGIALTREDFGPSGFAQLYSMCSSSRSCALVQDEGLTSAFIVAHETGHLLGLEHDGEGEASRCTNEGPRGSIMAAVIVARYDRYRWSKCSREVLKENLEYFQCLKNTPRRYKHQSAVRNHGPLYSLSEQCEFNFGKDFTTCTSFKYNPCRILWCKRGGSRSYCKTMRGPALEGTICGRNKHCKKGECVKFDNKFQIATFAIESTVKEEPKTVDGHWGYWSKWTSCSKTCLVGIRTRRRKCDNPAPSPDGKNCTGKRVQREVCNTKQCDVKLLITRQIEQCQKVHGEDWTVYTDKDFNAKLWQPRSNPNCTFESGQMCNWKNDPKNDINWQVHSGATQSYNTGPSNDHTLKTSEGRYAYVEASGTRRQPIKQGDKARLISEAISVPRVCYTIHYHMFGKDMGKLRVKVKYKDNSERMIWEDSGNKGDTWYKTQVHVESVQPYRLILEAERGQHWASDIAVDDITAVTGFCSSKKTPTTRGACNISCRTRDAREFRMNVNVTDGTECGGRRSSNICIEGQCVKFGCDNKFGSKLEIDECGVCGGNGSRCLKVTKNTKIKPEKDYEILLSLEKGSTFIDILLEYSAAKYYYFFRTKHNNSLKMITKAEVVAMAANSAFHFTKQGTKQRIISDGPLSNPVDLIIFTDPRDRKNKHVDVEFEYYRPVDSEFTYKFVNKGWTKCSVSCGTGEQKTLVACIREQDKVVVDKSYCAGEVIPMYIRACRLNECPQQYRWLPRPWKACTHTCGGGVRIRLIQCVHNPTKNVVRDKFCRSLDIPSIREYCNNNPCPKWETSKWKSCSVSCGSGIQQRDVTCVDPDSRKVIDNDKCPVREKPDAFYPCNNQPCERYIYIIYEQGLQCTASCGGGKRAQIIKCVKNSTREEVDKIFCNGPSPPILADCNMHPCPEFRWEVLKESPCTSTCGNGTIVRDVACVNMDNDQPSHESNCRGVKPIEFKSCYIKPCPILNKWKVHESSPCSKTCGNGTITRELACVEIQTGKRVSESDCPQDKIPPANVPCFLKKCIEYEVRYSEWGKCSVSCGNGIQRRTFSCHEKSSGRQVVKNACIKNRIQLEQQCTSTIDCQKVDKLFCDFDKKTFCNWSNMKGNDFDWSIDKKTPSVYTGPDYDHTTKQGYFAFIEASLPRKRGEKARLYSPYLQVEKGCFSFWYHMRGEGDMGRLRVLLSTSSQDELIFEKNGHQGTYWLQAKINIVKKSRYRLIIEATRGSGVYSDAAIDDLHFSKKDCDNNYKKRIQTVRPTLNCREISPYCNHRYREQYCKGSPAYRNLCCKTCPRILNSKKPNVTVVAFAKIKN